MQGYLIDAKRREVRPIEYEYGDICRLIGCDMMTQGWTYRNGDVIYVDDEGLTKPCEHYFRIRSRRDGQPLSGNGFVTGRDSGNTTLPPVMSAMDVWRDIEWLTREQFMAWVDDNREETALSVTREDGVTVRATWGDFFGGSNGKNK